MPKARVRATTNLREAPPPNKHDVETLQAGTPVNILEDQGDWLHVQAANDAHAIPGWASRESLAFPPAEGSVLSLSPILYLATVKDFQAWKDNGGRGRPSWIPEFKWKATSSAERRSIRDKILGLFQAHQTDWDTWLEDRGNDNEALMEEWLVTLQGGRDVWTVRSERIFPEAEEKGGLGWAVEDDIMRWTGRVKRNDREKKYKIWYEVSLLKSGKMLKGWFKGSLIEPYVYPTETTDTAIVSNKEAQFDLTYPLLRFPADPEIAEAIANNRQAFQYIDIFNVLGIHKIHHNLCGEFCAATLAGVDMIPFLKKWKAAYPGAEKILRHDEATGLGDVRAMLDVNSLKFEDFRFSPSIVPVSPIRLLQFLREGKMIFWGVAIFKTNGQLATVNNNKTTRHWIVLEDVIQVGNGGWVRIYNPFRNREEIYDYNLFMQSVGQFGIGLLVDVSKSR